MNRFLPLVAALALAVYLPAQTDTLPLSTPQTLTDTAMAYQLFRESVTLIEKEDYPEARQRLWAARNLLEKAGEPDSKTHALVLHQQGILFLKTRQPDSALVVNEAARKLREKVYGPQSWEVYSSWLNHGEGVLSIARAFHYAGAKSLVATFWKIDDDATERLMALFYRNLYAGMPKDTALWKAKRDFRTEKNGQQEEHPYFWAAFVPIGDMAQIRK